jgi:maltooligosyltrehalose trehalohydrolase
MNYKYPDAGAIQVDKDLIAFTVWAPLCKSVDLILHETKKTSPMIKDNRGYWSITVDHIPDGSTYSFQLDHDKILPDPASRWQPHGVHGPSAIVGKKYLWTDSEWKGLALDNMIIYELHVGTFTAQGTFEGVISKLPYLQSLGINAIELMPLAQFPGCRNWGYDGVYPFAVQDSYGGAIGLKQLVNEAHAFGIAIILDVVYNHQGPEGNYLDAYAPYFTDKYKTFWGSAINFDDAWCDGVRNFYWQNALQWLDEFHIDGLRLDAVHAIWDVSANHFIRELKRKVAALEEQRGRKKILIAEFDLNNPRYIDPPSKGGYGLDGQWVDEFHHALHAIVTDEKNGYYEDFGDVSHLVKSLEDSYVYTGQYSIHRKKEFGVLPQENPYTQFVVFSQNHDQIGNRLLGDRLTAKLSFECLKVVAATVLLSPHVPMLFMGEEYGEKNPFQYFISHTDKELVEMVRKGRKKEFAYFGWKDEVPDPQAKETFENCKLSWPIENDEQAFTLYQFYKYLINFRKERKAMAGRERNTLRIVNEEHNNVIHFSRAYNNDLIHVILNFNKTAVELKRENSFLSEKKIFDSSSTLWNGPGELASDKDDIILINKESVVVFA